MKRFKNFRNPHKKVQIRFVPFGAHSWVMEYRIDPKCIKWYQRLFNKWIKPKLIYNPGINYPQSPIKGWSYLIIALPEEANYYRSKFITYRDLLKFSKTHRDNFMKDMALYEKLFTEHSQIL